MINRKNKQKIYPILQEKWYGQGFNCTPLLLVTCGSSGFYLNPVLGDSFKHFLYEFKEDYGKMYYPIDDLERLYYKIMEKLKSNPSYLQELQKKSEKAFAQKIKILEEMTKKDFSKASWEDLSEYIKAGFLALRESVGYAHIIEPFSLVSDLKIKERLSKYIKDNKQLNQALALLSTPSEKSFLNEREEDLHKISQIKDASVRKNHIKNNLQKFFWVRNSYSGRVQLTVKDIEEEMKSVHYRPVNLGQIKQEKKKLIEKLKLDQELILLLKTLDFMTNWQDSRKKNVLIALDYTERLLEKASEKSHIDVSLLRYLVAAEFDRNIFACKNLKKILSQRKKGVIIYSVRNSPEIILSGEDYVLFHKTLKKSYQENVTTKKVNGLSASIGSVIGPVKICKTMEDIYSVKEGDILVAGMTRPEFLPAMRKAAAFVTDEGGITCHAAIVAREMKKPCIIGTKIATQVFKDGDIVEVKGNHGQVVLLR